MGVIVGLSALKALVNESGKLPFPACSLPAPIASVTPGNFPNHGGPVMSLSLLAGPAAPNLKHLIVAPAQPLLPISSHMSRSLPPLRFTPVPPCQVEVIGFSDEEGVRFHTTFLGSKAVTGMFKKELLASSVDKTGVSLGEARHAGNAIRTAQKSQQSALVRL